MVTKSAALTGRALVAFGLLIIAPAASGRRHGHAAHPRDTHAAHRAKPAARDPVPAGATAIPAGGLKVHCAGAKSPLLVRKSTQGNGTTVTVICR